MKSINGLDPTNTAETRHLPQIRGSLWKVNGVNSSAHYLEFSVLSGVKS